MPLAEVFAALRAIMLPYAQDLDCVADTADCLYVNTRHMQRNKKPLFFGAVQIKKNYVSYYLMPVYVNPSLLEPVSPSLKKRMQGKSCFNFSSPDASLFNELAAVTKAGYEDYQRAGFV